MLQGRSGSPGGGFQATAEHRRGLDASAEQPEAGRLRLGPWAGGTDRGQGGGAGRGRHGGRRGGDHRVHAAGQAQAAARLGAVRLQLHPAAAPRPQRAQLLLPAGAGIISLYDCVFKRRLDYDQKLHRDDREHAKSLGLHVNEEEQERPVGVLTSSVYGKRIRQPIEPLNRDFGRVNHVQADFYRKNDIPSLKAPGFGHMAPA
uniref:uncharacterized protein C5orf49 homolog isoform X1 n=1 Tax=Macaca mulatta TaxID=9544 RepID=UPI0010A22D4E|nr:uncharacterized protein C5orf49 homolog isoform X1 [Macaca mulatta]